MNRTRNLATSTPEDGYDWTVVDTPNALSGAFGSVSLPVGATLSIVDGNIIVTAPPKKGTVFYAY